MDANTPDNITYLELSADRVGCVHEM